MVAGSSLVAGAALPDVSSLPVIYADTYRAGAAVNQRRINGVEYAQGIATFPAAPLDTGTDGYGAYCRASSPGTGGWIGDVYDQLIYNRALSDAEQDVVIAMLAKKYTLNVATKRNSQIVCIGDSQTRGYQASLISTTYPANLAALLASSSVDVCNAGHDGIMTTDILSNSTNYLRQLVTPVRPANVALLMIGTNDLTGCSVGANVAIYGRHQSIVSALIGFGYSDVLLATIINRSFGTGYAAQQETERLALNALMRANGNGLAYTVVDFASLTIPLADGLHPNDMGYLEMANYAEPIALAAT